MGAQDRQRTGHPPKSVHRRDKKAIRKITEVENKIEAKRAVEEVAREFGTKRPQAVAKIVDEKEMLLAFYDFLAEHRVHLLRTANPL